MVEAEKPRRMAGDNTHSAQLPLSEMQSPPLDMTRVNVRSQASRKIAKRIRPYGPQEAPTFRPTAEEFKDPFKYLEKITPEASQYGICKIIPPDSWKPEFAIDTKHFHFQTQTQNLSRIEGRTRVKNIFLDQLAEFHRQQGTDFHRFPTVNKRPLDLYELKKAVETRGGFNNVCEHKKWAEIGRELGYAGNTMSTSLKNSYWEWLHAYEIANMESTPDGSRRRTKRGKRDAPFSFGEGDLYSLEEFRQKDADFKEHHFRNKTPFVSEDDIKTEFWRIVASPEETIEVEYGADIHSATHGSGFPTVERNPLDPYSRDPWNLNNISRHSESLFHHFKSDISGMSNPWLYVGMTFSTFCWHNEDHNFYSANYQHFGSTKTWYGIPGEYADKFEAAMRNTVPELFETQPDLLFQLVTLLAPEQLRNAGVPVYALDQRAGEFVIAFPKAYHAGFNHGFNFNESINFAPPNWEPFGAAGVERYQQIRRQPCFSHDEMLWTAATRDVKISAAKWLAPALARLRDREATERQLFIDRHKAHDGPCVITDVVKGGGTWCPIGFVLDDSEVPEKEYQCTYCKTLCYISRFQCKKSGKVMCLRHAGNYRCCNMSPDQRYAGGNHTLTYRQTPEAIEAIYRKIWEEKLDKMLEEGPTPSLETLRAILNEGERIPYESKSLLDLRAFVHRCNEWVDKATKSMAQKQQNGRELQNIEEVKNLLEEAGWIGFDCPEMSQLINAAFIHYPRLETLYDQIQPAALPTLAKTLAAIDLVLSEKRDADRRVISLCERSKNEVFTRRPKYSELRETLDHLTELNIYPGHNLKELQNQHEDWMRKGKVLFDKADAPLHILKSHMTYVLKRNIDCFDINADKPELSPVKPASLEDHQPGNVFCICRRNKAGAMFMCELCYEWYHSECFEIVSGKPVKKDEKLTCAVCDWRKEIPRNAARPKLEDLQAWQDEIPMLPFQPDEEQMLEQIINTAQEFRKHVIPIMDTVQEPKILRFYLRKIEGAEIFLALETNFFRQELLRVNDHDSDLSCPDCNATNFPNLSKLKHRNSHNLPYKCLDCGDRFSQRQGLDRHTDIKHMGTDRPTKYYHCIVDGCKYASTGTWKKFFARMDQVKAHIKDYGHYGPHSASDRPRRPGNCIATNEIIKAAFEEWTLESDENGILLPQKCIQPCEYDPQKTKLWHEDDIGDLYLHANAPEDNVFVGVQWHQCLVPDCYYQLLPPGGLGPTVFKTSKGLLQHCRGAHELSSESASQTLQYQAPEGVESGGTFTDFAEMSTRLDISPPKSGPSVLGVQENIFNDEDFLRRGQYQSQTWETTDSQLSEGSTFFSDVIDAPILHLSSSTTYSSTNGSDLWISTPRSENGDNRSSIGPFFTSVMSLAKPRSIETSLGRIKCKSSGCDATFKRRGDMKRHLNSVHRQSTSSTCYICKQQFSRRDAVKQHLLLMHRFDYDSDSMHLRSLTLIEENVKGGGAETAGPNDLFLSPD